MNNPLLAVAGEIVSARNEHTSMFFHPRHGLAAALIVCLGLCPAACAASDVQVLLTKVDDGDAKHAELEGGSQWKDDIRQDDDFAMLHDGTTPLVQTDPGQPVTLGID